jgi:muramoyltetrapeptide carboxypeptidase
MTIIPKKLCAGDQIRVIAPSSSLAIISDELRSTATQNLARLGLQVTFGERAQETNEFHTSSIEARVSDLHAAFTDPQVKGILTAIGGYNANQLLRYLDYDLIRANPKIFCGFSDITALENAIFAITGLVTYSGPHFSTLGMHLGLEYTLEYIQKCLMEKQPFDLLPSETWSDDPWYRHQQQRDFIPNPGYQVVYPGQAEGRILGGNLCTLNLLQGTEYMPDLKDSILFIEDDDESPAHTFDRDLQSLLHQPGFTGVRGLLIGRFQKASQIDENQLLQILHTKRELQSIPVVINANFGHCTPQFTFPIGGTGSLRAEAGNVRITIQEH